MENIDCIYYINLEHRTDRKEQFLNEMKKIEMPESKITRIEGIYTPNMGIVGCGYSHLKAIKTFITSNHKNCIIFEDDFVFSLNPTYVHNIFNLFFKENIPYDVLMLGANVLHMQPTQYTFLQKVLDAQAGSAYLITREFAPKLEQLWGEYIPLLERYHRENNIKVHEYCNDICWKVLQPQNRWYVFNPKLGYQNEGYSDNEQKFVDYKV
jgi:GR25 family glycosyltransferase involved in LPS biosynthesis